MAAIKKISQESGIDVEYWRIASLHVYFPRNAQLTAVVEVEGYVNGAARTGGKAPAVTSVQISLQDVGTAIATANGDVRGALYTLLAADGMLSGAVKG